jgi:hypothetical protein
MLGVSACFLAQTILQVWELGFDAVDLDEIHRRRLEKNFGRRFVCFALNDGCQTNFTTACLIYIKHNALFDVCFTIGLPAGTAVLWRVYLEQLIRIEQTIDLVLARRHVAFSTDSNAEKIKAFSAIYRYMHGLPQKAQQEAISSLLKACAANSC